MPEPLITPHCADSLLSHDYRPLHDAITIATASHAIEMSCHYELINITPLRGPLRRLLTLRHWPLIIDSLKIAAIDYH